jgi:hypothetical protein
MKDYLRRTVPSRGHIIGVWRSRADLARKSKICQAQIRAISLTEQVFRFNIAVEETMPVHVGKALKKLVHYGLDLPVGKGSPSLRDHVEQIAVNKIKHEIELLILLD